MAFMDLSFPRDVAGGVSGGPEFRVDIVSLASGDEERNARWRDARRSYDAGLGVRHVDDLAAVLAHFKEVGGQLHSFRFRDWSDFSTSAAANTAPAATDQAIGTGDGTTTAFQITKTYGTLVPYSRDVTKPVAGSVLVALDGTPLAAGWTVNNLTGVITFTTAPANGVAITAGCLFDVPVRFDTPRLDIDMNFFSTTEGRGVGQVPSIPLIEVKE